MRRLRNGILTLSLLGALAALPSPAAANGQGGPPLHGHMLILGLEFDPQGEPIGYQKCVDLANNKALPLHAHHDTVHTGTAGEALREHAGHFVVPTAPLTPFRDCAHLAELFGPPSK
jgi:hypothetical protein